MCVVSRRTGSKSISTILWTSLSTNFTGPGQFLIFKILNLQSSKTDFLPNYNAIEIKLDWQQRGMNFIAGQAVN